MWRQEFSEKGYEAVGLRGDEVLADAVRFKMPAPQGWVIVSVRVGWVAGSQPLSQVLGVIARVCRKKLEKADGVLLILDIGERGGGHCLARQLSIEGFHVLGLSAGGSCGTVGLEMLVGIDGEARRPVFSPVALLVAKNFFEQLARRATLLSSRLGACVQEGVDCDEEGLGVHGIIELIEHIARRR